MKKCIATILAVLMLAVTPLTAYATEVETHTESNANVTFYITDETNGEYPGQSRTSTPFPQGTVGETPVIRNTP